MRRSATRLTLSLVVLMLVPGCGLFGKKKSTNLTADAGNDPYAAPAYEEPVRDYDPYGSTRTAVGIGIVPARTARISMPVFDSTNR